MTSLCRSVLYIPGSSERALEKARALPCDALIFDLEDAVAPEEKERARRLLLAEMTAAGFGHRLRIVRINALDTPWGRADAEAFGAQDGVDALLVPKVNGGADLDAVAAIAPEKPLWAMMETGRAVQRAGEIAAHSRLEGLVMGTNDLARELGCRVRADRLPLQTALCLCLMAARAEGRLIVDGVYNAFRDAAGFAGECAQGRDLGFDGKTLIHPLQIDAANAAFAPDAGEVTLARRQIDAFDAAVANGRGVAVVDGKIVENLHIVTARALLAKAAAIAAME